MMSRKHHLMTDPPGTSWCGELSGFPLTLNPGDYHRHDDGIDTGINKSIFYPDFWCPKCVEAFRRICPGKTLKVVFPCENAPRSQCSHSETIVNHHCN